MPTPNYSITADPELSNQLNPLLQSIADRLSQLEGVRGKPVNQGYAADTGAANRYIIDPDPPWQSDQIVAGTKFKFIAANTNSGASTLTVNGNEYDIVKDVDDALTTNDIVADTAIEVVYDGTNMQLVQATTVNLTRDVTGTLPFANGGTGGTAFAANRVPYSNGTVFTSASNFTFDATTLTIPGQIAFPATQSASAGANVLDDYEEGTWTPVLWDDSLSNSESQTYTTQVGRYTKIGNTVFIRGRLVVNSVGTLTTTEGANIGGLPFTSATISGHLDAVCVGRGASLAIAVGSAVGGFIDSNTNYIQLTLWDAAGGTTALLVSEFSAGGDVTFSAQYQV